MAKGKYKLYYENEHGVKIACSQVKYKIVDSMRTKTLAQGETDAQGETLAVQGLEISQNTGGTVQAAKRGTDGATRSNSFRLMVYDPEKSAFEAVQLHPKETESDTVNLPTTVGGAAVVRSLRLRAFHKVRFVTKGTQIALANAKYRAYTRDAQGKEAVARDDNDQPISGSTDARG